MSPLGGLGVAMLKVPTDLIGIAKNILDIFEQREMVFLERQQVVGVMLARCPGYLYGGTGQPRASVVITAPAGLTTSKSSGMMVISSVFSGTCCWASTIPRWLDQTLTVCSAQPPQAEPLALLPLTAKTLSAPAADAEGTRLRVQARKRLCQASGLSTANNRSKVSWLGIPAGKLRNSRNHTSCAKAY